MGQGWQDGGTLGCPAESEREADGDLQLSPSATSRPHAALIHDFPGRQKNVDICTYISLSVSTSSVFIVGLLWARRPGETETVAEAFVIALSHGQPGSSPR